MPLSPPTLLLFLFGVLMVVRACVLEARDFLVTSFRSVLSRITAIASRAISRRQDGIQGQYGRK
jgi:hypothetical protein